MVERRLSPRHDACVAMAVEDEGGARWPGLTHDISRTGVLLWTQAQIAIGQPIRLWMHRDGERGCVVGEVVREQSTSVEPTWWSRQVAVSFLHTPPGVFEALLDDLELFSYPVDMVTVAPVALLSARR